MLDNSGISRRTFITGAAMTAIGTMTTLGIASAEESGQASIASTTESSSVSDNSTSYTTFACDVLVIGGGSAGTEAAINAVKSGAVTILVDKKAFSKCGDSGLHSSGRMTSSWLGLDGDSPDAQLEDACECGYWLVNQTLGMAVMQGYADEKAPLKSENYGNIHWRDPENGKPWFSYSCNKPRLWEGYKLTNHSMEAVKCGVHVLDYTMVTKILTDASGSPIGVTAVDYRTGEFYVIRAKAVIMATGGECQIFGAGGICAKYAGGAYGLTGDGHALVAPLGVEFRDMEFRSNNFGAPLEPNPIANFISVGSWDPTEYKDKDGNYILKDVPVEEMTNRRVMYELQKMNKEGRGGEHGGYFAPVNYKDRKYYGGGEGYDAGLDSFGFYVDDWAALARQWEVNGMDLSNLEQWTNFCYDYGGMVTNEKAETSVPGLYATGECAMHTGAGYGVFRSFSSALVTGKWAGENSAAYAEAHDMSPIDWSVVNDEHNRVYDILNAQPEDPLRVNDVRHAVQDAAWEGAGDWRSEAKCAAALATLDDIETDDLPRMHVREKSPVCNTEWFEALETINMFTIARIDINAARTRTESRGYHLRDDYPDEDNDNWIKNVYVWLEDGQIKTEARDVDTSLFPAPGGVTPQGGGCIEDEFPNA